MSHRIFYRSVGPTMLSWDPKASVIVFSTPMYDPTECRQVVREVTITEEEWLALIKYGEEAGFAS